MNDHAMPVSKQTPNETPNVTPDSRPSKSTSRFDRFLDRLNPVLVKEVRQVARGRAFFGWFLVIGVIGAAFAIIAATSHENVNAIDGGEIIGIYFACLAFVALVIVPLSAYFSLTQEAEDQTLDLVTITSLSPASLYRGKLASSIVLGLAFTSTILPFMAFCYLLRGIDLLTILFLAFSTLLVSVFLTNLALMLGALAKGRWNRWKIAATLACIVIATGITMTAGVFEASEDGELGNFFAEASTVTGLVALTCLIALFASYSIVFYYIGVGHLSPHPAVTVAPIRIWLVLQAVAVLVGIAAVYSRAMGETAVIAAFSLAWITQWFVFGIFATTEDPILPRRLQDKWDRRRGFHRFASMLFFPGPRRGWALFLVGLVIGAAVFVAMALKPGLVTRHGLVHHRPDEARRMAMVIILAASYAVIFIGATLTILRRIRPTTRTLERQAIFGSLPVAMVLSGLLFLAVPRSAQPATQIFNPLYTIVQVTDGHLRHQPDDAESTVFFVALLAALAAIGATITPRREKSS